MFKKKIPKKKDLVIKKARKIVEFHQKVNLTYIQDIQVV